MASIIPSLKFSARKANGQAYSGGKLYAYAAGTSTPKATYTTSTGSTQNSNPIILDSRGEADVYLGAGSYDFWLFDSSNNLVYTVYGIAGDSASSQTMGFCTNYDALRALSTTPSYSVVYVAGKEIPNDGGEGAFLFNPLSTTSDDDGIVLTPSSAPAYGRWFRQFEGAVNVLWYGASRDGITDSTDAFNSANVYANSNDIDNIVVPNGNYITTGIVSISPNVQLTVEPGVTLTSTNFNVSGVFVSQSENIFTSGSVVRFSQNSINLNWFSSLPDAVNSINSATTTTLILSNNFTLSGNITIPTNSILTPSGGILTGSFHVFVSGSVDVNDRQWLSNSTSAHFVGGCVKPSWWGADPLGVSDSYAAIQLAIDSTSNGSVYLKSGSYLTSQRLNLHSNLDFGGDGPSTKIISTDSNGAFLLSRTTAATSATPHTNVNLHDFYAESPYVGGSPTPTHAHACIEMEFCNNSHVKNVVVGKADDACIRFAGYCKDIVSFTTSFSNPGFYNAKFCSVENCTVSGGYLGLELVGGAQCDLLNNTVISSYYHGIRLAGGGWFSNVLGNRVMACNETALYVDGSQYLNVSNNLLISNRASQRLGLSLGLTLDCNFYGNDIVGDVIDSALTSIGNPNLISFSENSVSGNARFSYATNSKSENNVVTGDIRYDYPATGIMRGNLAGSIVSPHAARLIQGGGYIDIRDNVSLSTFHPLDPTKSWSNLGVLSAAPVDGTFSVNDFIFYSNPAINKNVGMVCVAAGTPGTWADYGTILSPYCRDFVFRDDGNNQRKNIIDVTVPNSDCAIWLTVEGMLTRAPGSSIASSRINRSEFFISRNSGTSAVPQMTVSGGDSVTTTAGGSNTPSTFAYSISVESGAASSSQIVSIWCDFKTAVTYGVFAVKVKSTSPISTFTVD